MKAYRVYQCGLVEIEVTQNPVEPQMYIIEDSRWLFRTPKIPTYVIVDDIVSKRALIIDYNEAVEQYKKLLYTLSDSINTFSDRL